MQHWQIALLADDFSPDCRTDCSGVQPRRQCSGTGMKRVGFVEQVRAGARHPAAHGRRQIHAVMIFQRVNEGARDIVVAHDGAGAMIARRMGDGLHRQLTVAAIERERRAEPFAVGPGDERRSRPAGGAKTFACDRCATGQAQRRQRDIAREPDHARAAWRQTRDQRRKTLLGTGNISPSMP